MKKYKVIRISEEVYRELAGAKGLMEFQLREVISWDKFFKILMDYLPKVKVDIDILPEDRE